MRLKLKATRKTCLKKSLKVPEISSDVMSKMQNTERELKVSAVNPSEEEKEFSDEENQQREEIHTFKLEELVHKKSCSLLGIVFTVLYAFCFASSAVIVKLSGFDGAQMTAIRGIGQALLAVPVGLYTKRSLLGERGERLLLLGRGIFGANAILCAFLAVQRLPVGDATVIIFTSPVFVSAVARFILKEPCSSFLSVTILLTLAGVVVVTKPPFIFGGDTISQGFHDRMLGIAFSFGSMVSSVAIFIILRKIKKSHYIASVFAMAVGSFIIGTTVAASLKTIKLPSTFLDGVYFIGVCVCGFAGQILFTSALQIEKAGPVSVVRSTTIVFAFTYQIAVFGQIPDWTSILGSIFITCAVLMTGINRWYNENPETFSMFVKRSPGTAV